MPAARNEVRVAEAVKDAAGRRATARKARRATLIVQIFKYYKSGMVQGMELSTMRQ